MILLLTLCVCVTSHFLSCECLIFFCLFLGYAQKDNKQKQLSLLVIQFLSFWDFERQKEHFGIHQLMNWKRICSVVPLKPVNVTQVQHHQNENRETSLML